MTYIYQDKQRYFAQVGGGMESLAAQELVEWGAYDISESYRGVYFCASHEDIYRISYSARLISRVIAPLTSFVCHHTDQLYKKALSMQWTDFFNSDQTFAIFSSITESPIRHSKFAALRIKDGIVDNFRKASGERPGIDTKNPDVWLNLYIDGEYATIGLDLSGRAMHRRGYRQSSGAAPMQETLAAAILRLTAWNGERPLHDPFCGSGTILAEALMQTCQVPAGYLHDRFGFENLPDFDGLAWKRIRREIDSQVKPLQKGLLMGSDIDERAVNAARQNLSRLPGGENARLEVSDYQDLPVVNNVDIVCNPPYGLRMGESSKMAGFYKTFGDFLKQSCTGATAYIYFGERQYLKNIGLRTTFKVPLVNGALDGRLAKFELY